MGEYNRPTDPLQRQADELEMLENHAKRVPFDPPSMVYFDGDPDQDYDRRKSRKARRESSPDYASVPRSERPSSQYLKHEMKIRKCAATLARLRDGDGTKSRGPVAAARGEVAAHEAASPLYAARVAGIVVGFLDNLGFRAVVSGGAALAIHCHSDRITSTDSPNPRTFRR